MIADDRHRRAVVVEPTLVTYDQKQAAEIHEELTGGGWSIEDWQQPDYLECIAYRAEMLQKIRDNAAIIPALKLHYKYNPADFIDDWGYTYDPRNVEVDLPAKVPFLLFPKQREWIEFVMRKWRERKPGLTEKSRDCGISWLSVGLGCTLCLHYDGLNIGYGSRKQEYVDKKDTPKALFYKARKFMEYLPPEFNGGWDPTKDAPQMRLTFRATESTMSGETGDSIGRGDRASIYFVDEAAHLERPVLVEQALSQTTNCQQDISSVKGMANPFAKKRHSGKVEVFVFDWRDDPRKDLAWYEKQVAEQDPITVAQEVDRNYLASVEGVVVPNEWVQAAIDAHLRLKFEPTGAAFGTLDVADEGIDKNAFVGGKGVLVDVCQEWSGKGSDIFGTVERAFDMCDEHGYASFRYDADGLGAGVRGDARILNEKRAEQRLKPIRVVAFRGSAKVFNPDRQDFPPRLNKDFFKNLKAQGWWLLRRRFQNTYRAVNGKKYDPDDIISLSSQMDGLSELVTELSQPTYEKDGTGKILINKTPEGTSSPNKADGVMMRFAPLSAVIEIDAETLEMSKRPSTRKTLSPHRPNTGGRVFGARLKF